MKEYKEIVYNVLNYGNDRDTRSGKTISTFGVNFEHDMRDGFPALTTKQIPFKTGVAELLMFLNGVPDRRIMQEYLYGHFSNEQWDIWKQDCVRKQKDMPNKFNGYNLGEMYPVYFRNLYAPSYDLVKVERRLDLDSDYVRDTSLVVYDNTSHEFVGTKHKSNKGFDFVVIEFTGKNTYMGTEEGFKCQFLESGYITAIKRKSDILKGEVEDYYQKTVCGVACRGNAPRNKKLYDLWYNMIARCYSNTYVNKNSYKEITVSPRWLYFDNFYNDVFSLPNFQKWANDSSSWCLDKDYYGADVYSRNTCLFIPKAINSSIGDTVYVYQNKVRSRKYILNEVGISSLSGVTKTVHGIKEYNCTNKFVYRPKLFIDQIQRIIDGIKNNPNSRYHILDNWNVDHENTAVLGACHTGATFYVDREYLDCHWSQRSCDVFLGLPVNIMSYALLMSIIAKICGLKPRHLSSWIGDTHIYKNHLEQVQEQLSRDEYKLPELILPEFDSISDVIKLTANDFKLDGYKHHPKIKAPLSVG